MYLMNLTCWNFFLSCKFSTVAKVTKEKKWGGKKEKQQSFDINVGFYPSLKLFRKN